uniref:Piwi domain-containing protein n=1 Tax=Chromera velia CCMP2878 TaxID=1169474 RepID=A0A0G4HQX1_9ALVE|eukprot:Cvel_1260.t1-p1 / transcript=Cvel_1260.t1 / gene=Cvel_1260 / organism=Chromera_velia_CCMP2878 / gene_product=Piwi-like protein 1, putative / transcript_product=Piwi-like protein 1, putative / location=Cvel_scaffold42:77299-81822(-) / protein_length=857 / sequence_SO=supercontig / SO=protein_coding / is_pseudo=false
MITQRPGYGTEGKAFVAVSNFRTIRLKSGFRVDICSVAFDPPLPEDTPGQRVKIIEHNKEEVIKNAGAQDLICTGGNVYLLNAPEERAGQEIKLTDLKLKHTKAKDGGEEVNDGDELKEGSYTVILKAKRELRITDERLLNEEQRMYFNLLVNRALRDCNLQQIGRHHYDTNAKIKVDCSPPLSLIPGYFTSMQVVQGGLALMSDVKHRIIQNVTAAEVMNSIMQTNNAGAEPKDKQKFLLEEGMKGKVIITNHGQQSNLYRIEGVEMELNIDSTFERREGPISYRDYFKQQYNMTLENAKMPMLKATRRKRDIFLPPEICYMTGLTDALKSNFQIMTAISKHTRMLPNARFKKGNQILEKLTTDTSDNAQKAQKVLNDWCIEMSTENLECEGRQVEKKKVRVMTTENDLAAVENNQGDNAGQEVNYNRVNFPHLIQRGVVGFQGPPGFQRWVVVHHARDEGLLSPLMDAIGEQLQMKGIRGQKPKSIAINSTRGEDFKNDMLRELKQLNARPDIILLILPRQNADRIYAAVKTEFCTEQMACPTQCIRADTLQKKGAQAAAKLFDQMICKQGGFLWGLNAHQSCPTMCVGIDLNTTGGRTVASFAASYNYSFTKYFSYSVWVKSREDAAEPFAMFLKRALDHFKDNFEFAKGPVQGEAKRFPARIIIYRDGVSEAAKQLLRDFEIKALLQMFSELDAEWAKEVELAYVMINKMIHQRFAIRATAEMLQSRGGRGGGRGPTLKEGELTNAQPLTIFDTGVTAEDKFDFFISHQEVTQGSVTPTHYDVLYWQPGSMTVNDLQRLTAQLSMLYQNWPGPIRVPAPVMYATKQCGLYSQIKSQKAVNRTVPWMLNQLYYL